MLVTALIIFFAQLIYVPILTLRTIMMVKGLKHRAAAMGMLEGAIYVVAIAIIFNDLSNYWNMAAYALGFGIGLFLGALIEEKLAIGYVSIEVNIPEKNQPLIDRLRELGFSVSSSYVEGMNSNRCQLDCTARRDREKEFIQIVSSFEPAAFIVSFEPRNFKGGYITKAMKRRRERYLKRKQKAENAAN
ncbi:DUF2179 domain-containing protein [Shouchella sp. JSM 1781072]|uniref:DUF2179 domain-containing protein n=1 Tax=Bacillaceae TaxID=186817 RepID=UPI000C06D5AC|nr:MULTISPECIES: DUF2179 domain-containing protein [Bacillaceae]UTR08039.1 DUF2179 domain-containing protein [Alkalihalobacillus sp. LMS6]